MSTHNKGHALYLGSLKRNRDLFLELYDRIFIIRVALPKHEKFVDQVGRQAFKSLMEDKPFYLTPRMLSYGESVKKQLIKVLQRHGL